MTYSPKWMSNDLKHLILQKKEAHKKYQTTKSPQNYITFSNLRSNCKRLSEICHKEYINKLGSQMDKKSFWKFVNSKKGNSEYPQCMT